MSDDDATPDWSLLPHDAQAFFDLADGFDRKDLKRAYNRFLRQFKPERFPQEFQRIRAAYELLDNQLRYGAAIMPSAATVEYRWQTDGAAGDATKPREPAAAQPNAPSAPQAPPPPAEPPLAERIRQRPLPEVYQELAKKTAKRPYDFYALAVMSDVVHRKDGHQFVRWLLHGLAEHRRDPALMGLLYEYLRGPWPIETAAPLLVAVSQVIRTDDFFALTEGLWQRVLRERPFPEFRKALETCETNLRDVGIDGRLAFTIEILKAAIWIADREWIERSFALIEENFERLPHLQYDLDLLDLIRRYVVGRPALATAHPLRRQIDQALRDFFTADQAQRDRSVLHCLVAMAQDPAATLDAFPLESEEDYSNIWILWNVVTTDVAERHATEAKPVNVKAWASRGRALFETIERRVGGTKSNRRWAMGGFVYAVVCTANYLFVSFFLTIIPTALFVGSAGSIAVVAPLVGMVVGIAAAFWIHFRVLRPRWNKFRARQATKCYVEVSRDELAAFLQRSNFTHQELRQLLFSCDITGLTMAQSTADHFQGDYALAIYAISLRFQV